MSKPRLPFGLYARRALALTPTDYLAWVLTGYKLTTRMRAAVRAELAGRPDYPELPPEAPPKRHHCFRCGPEAGLLVYWVHGPSQRVIRADCKKCKCFVCHLPQTPKNAAVAAQDREAAVKAARHGSRRPAEKGQTP